MECNTELDYGKCLVLQQRELNASHQFSGLCTSLQLAHDASDLPTSGKLFENSAMLSSCAFPHSPPYHYVIQNIKRN